MTNEQPGNSLIDDLSSIPGKSSRVREDATEIEEDLDSIEEVYTDVVSHADEGLPEEYRWRHSPDQRTVEDTEIEVTSDLDKIETDVLAAGDSETIQVEGGTVSEYLDRLIDKRDEKRELRAEFQGRIDSVKELSTESLNEFLESTAHLGNYESPGDALEGTWGEKLDQRLAIADGKRETRRILEDIVLRAEAEEDAIEEELVDTVNEYVDEAYDRAVEISQQLGGKGRPHARELDLLSKVSESRASILENSLEPENYTHNSSEVAEQSGVLDKGKEAMEKQAYLVAQYAAELDGARSGIQEVIEKADGAVDDEDLEYARERLEAMEEGYEELGNAVAEECYDSLSDAVREIMRQGMSEEESFDSEGDFSFQNLPYLGSQEAEQMR